MLITPKEAIKNSRGRIMGITYRKPGGEERVLNAKLDTDTFSERDEKYNMVTLRVQNEDTPFRSLKLKRISEIRLGGNTVRFDHANLYW
jgi:hypothetical protein